MSAYQEQVQKIDGRFDQQAAKLAKRRDELRADHDRLSRENSKLKQSLGTAALEGKDSSTDPSLNRLIQNKARLDAIAEAINQADGRLQQLEMERSTEKDEASKAEFHRIVQEADAETNSAIAQLLHACELLDAAHTKLQFAGTETGRNVDYDDFARGIDRNLAALKNLISVGQIKFHVSAGAVKDPQ
jgi:seryl-tRNA synthetase